MATTISYRRAKDRKKRKRKERVLFTTGWLVGCFEIQVVGGLHESLVQRGRYGEMGHKYRYLVDEKPE